MSDKVTVACTKDFMKALQDLSYEKQSQFWDFLPKFIDNHLAKGIHYEKLDNRDDGIYSAKIDVGYRVIIKYLENEGLYVLLYIGDHVSTYRWIQRRHCEVNSITGVLQLYQAENIDVMYPYQPYPSVEPEEKRLFDQYTDKELMLLGVPESLVKYVRLAETQEDIIVLQTLLPEDVFTNLKFLLIGCTLDEVLIYMADSCSYASSGTAKADYVENSIPSVDNPAAQQTFYVVRNEDEFRQILSEPLEEWRVFLHPTQRKIANMDFEGPVRVLGAAGTGKTVIAIHRAKYLASKCAEGEKILYTTFNTNLPEDIKSNLRKICTPEEMQKIDVINLDRWTGQFMEDNSLPGKLIYGTPLNNLWAKACEGSALDFEPAFYADEWSRVVIPNKAFTYDAYASAPRPGRGNKLGKKMKQQVWDVLEKYMSLMKVKKVRDNDTAMLECAKYIREHRDDPSYVGAKYTSIIVDEAQDFGDAAFCLIRAIAGDEHPNDIYITGDSHQRIYGRYTNLSKCGISVCGRDRSRSLRINYRTTDEIRSWALSLLKGETFDDLDGGLDPETECTSLTHGPAPVVKNFHTADDEVLYIAEEIQKLVSSGEKLADICVVLRTNQLISLYKKMLTAADIRMYEIKNGQAEERDMDAVRIATMHRVKGLEFKYVFIASLNKGDFPNPNVVKETNTPEANKEGTKSEKCLLYVAMTRAQKGVYLTSNGTPSELLPAAE
ncbi:MAG: UvrD-helicase domain-containing protein [Clostridia bacterium]|nr:UvrD-helicase domain-containing protein [Clostridia bacterium]